MTVLVFAISDFLASIYSWCFSVTKSVYRPFIPFDAQIVMNVASGSPFKLAPASSGTSHHSAIITLLSGTACPWLTLYKFSCLSPEIHYFFKELWFFLMRNAQKEDLDPLPLGWYCIKALSVDSAEEIYSIQ